MSNAISEFTRRDLFDELRLAAIPWWGRLEEPEFLARIFNLSTLPSYDRRCKDMAGDIYTHRHSFIDWEEDWVFHDARLNLMYGDDEQLLRFLSEMVHPVVRTNREEITKLLAIFNRHLAIDGFEVAHAKFVSNRPVYGGRQRVAGMEGVPTIARATADALSSVHISAQIDRLNGSVNTDPPLAIGTAKEFIETICKGILDARAVTRTGGEDLPRLLRMTRDVLELDDYDPNSAVRKVLNGIATVVQGVTELRGRHGTGHGPAPDAAMPEPVLARLVVQSALAVGVFLVDSHKRKVSALEPSF